MDHNLEGREEPTPLVHSTEEELIEQRAEGYFFAEGFRLRPSQVNDFKKDLEDLFNRYLNMSKEN